MLDLSKTYLYRMTHIENIPHIIQYGITHFNSKNANPNFVPIGDFSLIKTRNDFPLQNERTLGEYIPFYFGVRMPMLFVIQKGYNMVNPTHPSNIVYCVSSIQNIIDLELEFVFTDGHAIDKFSQQFGPGDISNIGNIIDKNAINAKYWKSDNDLDLKRRKEAEFLVLGDISSSAIKEYIVYNDNAKNQLIQYGINKSSIVVNSEFYF